MPAPKPNQDLDGPLDVQWVAHIVPKGGYPTPAAGDSTTDDPDWIGVDDPNYDDPDPPNDDDGEVKR